MWGGRAQQDEDERADTGYGEHDQNRVREGEAGVVRGGALRLCAASSRLLDLRPSGWTSRYIFGHVSSFV